MTQTPFLRRPTFYQPQTVRVISTEQALSVARAADVQTLWYLRSDLLSILAEFCGEPAARKQVEVLTQMFCGLIPAHQMGDRRLKAIQKRQAAAFAQVD